MIKVHQANIVIHTLQYGQFYDITEDLEKELRKSGIQKGLLSVNALHTTVAITLQEPDSTVHEDGRNILNEIIPVNYQYHHSYEGNINGAAHQRQMMVGNSRSIPVKDGNLVLGTWQRVFLLELFRPMQRKIFITIIGE